MHIKDVLAAVGWPLFKTALGTASPWLAGGAESLEAVLGYLLPNPSEREKLFKQFKASLTSLRLPPSSREAALLEAARVVSSCGDVPIAIGVAQDAGKFAEKALESCGDRDSDRVFSDQVRRVLVAFYDALMSAGLLDRLVDSNTLLQLSQYLDDRLRAVEDEIRLLRGVSWAPALRLLTKPWTFGKEKSLNFRALTAKYGVVPFHELTAFREVVEQVTSGSGLRVVTVSGQGGGGKTRLALELARRLSGEGWVAGFVPLGEDPKPLLELLGAGFFMRPKGYLFVFDYAFALAWGARISTFLLELVREGALDQGVPVAVLLLNRGRDEQALRKAKGQFLNTDSDPYNIPDLPKLANRALDSFSHQYVLAKLSREEARALFDKAYSAFRTHFPNETREAEDAKEAWARVADAPGFVRRPLPVLLAAYLAVRGELESLKKDTDLLDRALRFEGERWKMAVGEESSGVDLATFGRAVALATLLGGMGPAEEGAAFAKLSPQFSTKLSELMRRLFPDEGGGVAALEPDPLADRWLRVSAYGAQLEAFLGGEAAPGEIAPPDERLAEALAAVFELHKRNAQALGRRLARVDFVLTRAFAFDKVFLPFWRQVLEAFSLDERALAALFAAVTGSLSEQRGVASLDPAHPLQASPLMVALLERRLSFASLDQQERAGLLALLGLQLSALGLHKEACSATEEAVQHYRALTGKNHDVFQTYLAANLNNLGIRLAIIDHREEALKAMEEAVEIRRALVIKNREACLPGLAISLNNLGNILSNLGRYEESLGIIEEAIEIRRKLLEKNQDVFLPDLATSLNNLGNILSNLGRHEEALAVLKESVQHYRELAERDGEVFLPTLAMSLNNLGNILSNLGRHEEALEITEETTEMRRKFVEKNRDAFLPDLAASLNNLGVRLSCLGRLEEALKATKEAIEIRRMLVNKNQGAHLPDLAESLNNHGDILSALGHNKEALTMVTEAAQSLMPHFLRFPKRFGGKMQIIVGNYLKITSALGRKPEPALLCPLLQQADALPAELRDLITSLCKARDSLG